MADHATRVLAVTTNPSLVIGLTFLGRNWDVSSAASLDSVEAPGEHDVIVLDVDDLGAATAELAALGEGRPPAVIVSGQSADALPTGIRIASRPFTLDELAEHVELVLQGRDAVSEGTAVAEDGVVSGDGTVGVRFAGPDDDEQDEEDEDRWEDEGGDGHQEDAGGDSVVSGATAASGSGMSAASSAPAVSAGSASSAGAPASPPRDSARPLAERLFGRLARGGRGDRAAGATPRATEAAQPPDRPAWVPAPDHGDTDELLFADLAPSHEGERGDQAEERGDVVDLARYERQREARTGTEQDAAAPESSSAAPSSAGTSASGPAEIDVAAAASAVGGTGSASEWSARQQRDVSAEEQDLRSRLARVLAAAGELERLVDEVPLLRSRHDLARALAAEVQKELAADTVGIWLDSIDDRGWVAIAHHGFTSHEAKLIVGADQPLFAEVHATGGGLLIDPVESVQAAVAGIGGAHTESFMAASVAIGPGRFGIIAVGRNEQLTPEHLDLLCDLAQEAAPGLAVAEQLARFQLDGPAPDPIELIDRRPRSWTKPAPSRGPAPVG